MASQILSDGTFAAPINYDSAALSGLNNGEMITLNGGHVLIDSDVRWGYNAAVFGNLTVSSSLGGSVQMDGTKVWEVPFTGGTGSVPAVAEAGSNPVTGSGFTGELLRVWANGELAPRNPGTAMPAMGWIKLREKTGNASGQLARLLRQETGLAPDHLVLKYDGRPFTPEYLLRGLAGVA